MDVICRHLCHILHLAESVAQSADVGCESAVDSVRNGGMHKINRVLRQFGWRQRIPPPPQYLKDLHKVDMQGKDNIDWSVRYEKHIKAWHRRMQSILVRKQFFSADTTTVDDYFAWFRNVSVLRRVITSSTPQNYLRISVESLEHFQNTLNPK
ncbi:hypothetical protein Gohar_024687 [Gossypium harknessii]|uniref:Aminotransferase-like plant mobile domain-containing protein n=1 Tax=Gossypium harknessii TaxID=34285 RepID=A0A7J9HJA5_9ROSI|nr:hypothetical protein [Gossypium harknessii]